MASGFALGSFRTQLGLFGALGVMVLACGGTVKVSRMPEGGVVIVCEKGMGDCTSKAEKVCGDKGYTIVGGYNKTVTVGSKDSAYHKVDFEGELRVYCGAVSTEEKVCGRTVGNENEVHVIGGSAPAPAVVPASGPAVTPAPAPGPAAAPARACVPGATQLCVGAGGCQGGQACRTDGSGFEPCDCGGAAKPPTAPMH